MIVWCSDNTPPDNGELIYCWNGFREGANVRSLLRYVEVNSDRLRARYLAWVHDLGEHRLSGVRLVDHLAVDDEFSFWWTSLFVEKSVYKSPLSDAIRLLAIEEIVREETPPLVRFVGEASVLEETIRQLCEKLGIDFESVHPAPAIRTTSGPRAAYRKLPLGIQALGSLIKYAWRRRLLRRSRTGTWFQGKDSVFFCSYFFNLSVDEARQGHYESRFWGELVGLLRRAGIHSNWLELYVDQDVIESPLVALDWMERFNMASGEQGRHAFIQGYLSVPGMGRILARWLRLYCRAKRLRGIRKAFTPEGSALSLWPLFKKDWDNSLYGPAAISGLIWIELFDKALGQMPPQGQGYYLCENQAWERALIAAWRRHRHGRLTAVPHATVRYWDMRCFSDPRSLKKGSRHSLPLPDRYALNGQAAMDAFLGSGYPRSMLVECEALRFGYLGRMATGERRLPEPGRPMRVLVLGDYLESATKQLMLLLVATVPALGGIASFTIKPHPNFPIRAADYPAVGAEITGEPLGAILPGFDVAFASNLTSAAVDAFQAGLPVIVMNDDRGLNFSPLRGEDGVWFVSEPAELADALRSIQSLSRPAERTSDYFYLDDNLKRWRKLLSLSTDPIEHDRVHMDRA